MTTKSAITGKIPVLGLAVLGLGATPALAEAAPPTIDAGDTAWMIAATGLVLMMTIPGLALFYCGMVRKKNVLATMAQSLLCTALCSILWVAIGYSLAFNGDGALIGNLDKLMLRGIGMDSIAPSTKIPEMLFMAYQMTFAIITVALVAGSVADRMRFSAFVWFAALWLLIVYVPIAHWVWGGGWLTPDATAMKPGILDFAGGTVVHLNAGAAGLVAAYIVGNRQGYGSENFAPYDLSLAVIGTGLLWVGWFGFNGGSALGANSRAVFAIVATHLAASTGALTWMALEWWTRGKPARGDGDHRDTSVGLRRRADLGGAGMVDAAKTLGARHDLRRRGGSRHHHAGVRLCRAMGGHRHRHRRGHPLLLGLHQTQALARL